MTLTYILHDRKDFFLLIKIISTRYLLISLITRKYLVDIVCLFVCFHASRRDAWPLFPAGHALPAEFGPEPTEGSHKATRHRLPLPPPFGPRYNFSLRPARLSSSLSHYMQGQCLTRPSWGVKHWINSSRCDTTLCPWSAKTARIV
jgi:hypothetical protein